MMKTKATLVIALAVLLTACITQLRVTPVDTATGYLSTGEGRAVKATTVTSQKIDWPRYKKMAYVSNGGKYAVDQMKTLSIFETVLDYDDLQKIVVSQALQDKVPSLNEPIGLNKLSRAYRAFLWVHFKVEDQDGMRKIQLIATTPENLEDVFKAEVGLSLYRQITDQDVRYPLFNSFIDWVKSNRN